MSDWIDGLPTCIFLIGGVNARDIAEVLSEHIPACGVYDANDPLRDATIAIFGPPPEDLNAPLLPDHAATFSTFMSWLAVKLEDTFSEEIHAKLLHRALTTEMAEEFYSHFIFCGLDIEGAKAMTRLWSPNEKPLFVFCGELTRPKALEGLGSFIWLPSPDLSSIMSAFKREWESVSGTH